MVWNVISSFPQLGHFSLTLIQICMRDGQGERQKREKTSQTKGKRKKEKEERRKTQIKEEKGQNDSFVTKLTDAFVFAFQV